MEIFWIMIGLVVVGLAMLVWRYYRMPKDRREYEEFVMSKLSNEGFERLRLGKGSKDGGWDIIGHKGGQKRVVQVKKYKGNVGVTFVREILGVAFQMKGKAMIVTTHGYTKEATYFANATGVILRVMSIPN